MRRPQWARFERKNKQVWRRRGTVVAALLVVAVGVAVLLRPRAVVVDTATVDRGPLVVTVEEDARSHLREHLLVKAPASGELLPSLVSAGTIVEEDAVLARLRAPQAPLADRAERASAAAQIRVAQASVAQAQARLARLKIESARANEEQDRQRRLAAGGAVSAVAMRDAATHARVVAYDAESARAAAATAEAQLDQAKAAFQRTVPAAAGGGAVLELRAPFRAVVLDARFPQGGFVAASEPLFELANPDSLEIRVPLLTEDAAQIATGTEATITDWGGPALRARVREVEPRAFTRTSALGVEEQRTHVLLDLEEPIEGLPLGEDWAAHASIVRWRGADVVRVPAGALFRRGDRWAVFAMANGRARERQVETGQRAGPLVQVMNGLSPGDVVILYPAERVRDGQRVAARESAPADGRRE